MNRIKPVIRRMRGLVAQWEATPPELMSENERKLFDAIMDFERLATQKLSEILA